MTPESNCPLCSAVATVEARDEATWHVTCPVCLRFTLDAYLMDLFQAARQRSDERVLGLLPGLSDAAQQTAAEGGRLNLAAETWQSVARDSGARRK